ncbi:glycosyltransferase [Owenweeksia hongkongensis]|uniref:glycosyltransferase n=1 Tax=Owenweeksia hongkongensis TaxID=253245 RepID=UPI003A917EBF
MIRTTLETASNISSFTQSNPLTRSLVISKEGSLRAVEKLDSKVQAKPIAIVHEWLSTKAGSEKVTESFINLLQNVEVYSTVDFMSKRDRKAMMGDRVPKTTFIQKLPFARRHFRYYLPIFPFAIRSHKLADHSLILSSSHAFAHGVKSRPGQVHISYSHTPMRYIWDMQELYLESNNINKGPLALASRLLTYLLRKWDARVSRNVDYYISNSGFTAQRIKDFYGRDAHVIYPPVEVEKYEVEDEKEDFYVTASRLVCYKKVEMVVEAFNKMPDKKLVVIGDGKRKELIEKIAGPNIKILSHLKFDEFHWYMRKAKAFVFAGKEDFGITLVEAQACGTPVIAFGEGGAAEIVKDGETGLLFKEQTPESLIDAVSEFEITHNGEFSSTAIRKNSERFSLDRFNKEVLAFINSCVSEKSTN